MNLLHANAHVALYLDMRDLMARLGHRVYSWCVSEHMSLAGHDVPIGAHRAIADWMAIDAAFCDRFAATTGPHLRGFDAFIVDHPICMAALFEHTGKPVIANATTRYELGLTHSQERSIWLDETLRRMFDRGQLIPLSNNRGDRAYASEHLGFDWPTTPSLCEYTGMAWTGTVPTWLHASLGCPPLPRPYAWADLARHRGISHVPYTNSQMSIFEHYAAAIPLAFPSAPRLLDMALAGQAGALSQVSLRRSCNLPAGAGLNDYTSPECLARWIDLADWNDEEWMPGVVLVDDPSDSARLATIDAAAISAQVAAFLPDRRRRILQRWDAVLRAAARPPRVSATAVSAPPPSS